MIDRLYSLILDQPKRNDVSTWLSEDKRIRKKSHRRHDYVKRLNAEQAIWDSIYDTECERWFNKHGDEWLVMCTKVCEPPEIAGDIVWDEPPPTAWQRIWNCIKEAL